jgi:hypothetical protein
MKNQGWYWWEIISFAPLYPDLTRYVKWDVSGLGSGEKKELTTIIDLLNEGYIVFTGRPDKIPHPLGVNKDTYSFPTFKCKEHLTIFESSFEGRTLACVHDFYDENKQYHVHDTNEITIYLKCKYYHTKTIEVKTACWCGWKNDREFTHGSPNMEK